MLNDLASQYIVETEDGELVITGRPNYHYGTTSGTRFSEITSATDFFDQNQQDLVDTNPLVYISDTYQFRLCRCPPVLLTRPSHERIWVNQGGVMTSVRRCLAACLLAVAGCVTTSEYRGDPSGTYQFDASSPNRQFRGYLSLEPLAEGWYARVSFDGFGAGEVLRVSVQGSAIRVSVATPSGTFRIVATHSGREIKGRWSLGVSRGSFYAHRS